MKKYKIILFNNEVIEEEGILNVFESHYKLVNKENKIRYFPLCKTIIIEL